MKILVFGDIHGSFYALQKMIDVFESEKFDLMIIPGDFINHGPRNGIPPSYNPQKCAELFNRYSDKIIACRGNCDSEVDQMILSFPMMSDYAQIFFENDGTKKQNIRIFVHHGHLPQYADEKLSQFLPKSSENSMSIVISAHTHIPRFCENDGYTFLNAGSIPFPKGESKASFATIDTDMQSITLRSLQM